MLAFKIKKDRKTETELMEKILLYRREFRKSREADLLREREARHRNDEVFLRGEWVPRRMVAEIQDRLARRSRAIFVETLGLLGFLLFVTAAFWIFFKRFFLF